MRFYMIEYSSLSEMLDVLCGDGDIHVCVSDMTGITHIPSLKLPGKYLSHNSAVCIAAKSTREGMKTCRECKKETNRRAFASEECFSGHCVCGLFEAVQPIHIGGHLVSTVYVGNIVDDEKYAMRRLKVISGRTGVEEATFEKALAHTHKTTDTARYITMAKMIGGYISLLYSKYYESEEAKINEFHWAVATLKTYIENNYTADISLTRLAQSYFINEKYIGRLFKKQVGMSFHRYLNHIRTEHAALLLVTEDKSITDIALECGFQNVTYFNRVFFQMYGMTPTCYRASRS